MQYKPTCDPRIAALSRAQMQLIFEDWYYMAKKKQTRRARGLKVNTNKASADRLRNKKGAAGAAPRGDSFLERKSYLPMRLLRRCASIVLLPSLISLLRAP